MSETMNDNYICFNMIKMTHFTLSNLRPHSVTLTFTRGRCQGRCHCHSEMLIALQNADKCDARNSLIGHLGNHTSPELTQARSVAPVQQNCERTCQSKPPRTPSPLEVCASANEESAAPSSPA